MTIAEPVVAPVDLFPENFTLHVSQDHINNGLRKEALACPIALALIDRGYASPEVADTRIDLFVQPAFGGPEDCGQYVMEDKAATFIQTFDAGEEVAPTDIYFYRYSPEPGD